MHHLQWQRRFSLIHHTPHKAIEKHDTWRLNYLTLACVRYEVDSPSEW
jgi:hypothetical protein